MQFLYEVQTPSPFCACDIHGVCCASLSSSPFDAAVTSILHASLVALLLVAAARGVNEGYTLPKILYTYVGEQSSQDVTARQNTVTPASVLPSGKKQTQCM